MIEQIIDLRKYPILETDSLAYKELIEKSQKELRETGLCVLPGFILPKALELMIQEAKGKQDQAFHSSIVGNAYLKKNDPDLAKDHAFNMEDHTTLGVVAYDQISELDVIRQVYDCPEFLNYLADATGRAPIYYYECP